MRYTCSVQYTCGIHVACSKRTHVACLMTYRKARVYYTIVSVVNCCKQKFFYMPPCVVLSTSLHVASPQYVLSPHPFTPSYPHTITPSPPHILTPSPGGAGGAAWLGCHGSEGFSRRPVQELCQLSRQLLSAPSHSHSAPPYASRASTSRWVGRGRGEGGGRDGGGEG